MMLVTEGLPLNRRERGTGEDIIAGQTFLSMLMGSRTHRSRYKTSTTESNTKYTVEDDASVVREARSSPYDSNPRTFTDKPSDTFNQVNNNLDLSEKSSDSLSANADDGMIISVRVSSSVGQSRIDKDAENRVETTTDTPTTPAAVVAEETPSIMAQASKSDFSVDEREPITRNSETRAYEPLPSPMPLAYEASSILDKAKPYQETLIYHNNPREPNRARSVSYSTVIQSIPNEQKPWIETKKNLTNEAIKTNTPVSSAAETKDYYVTSKYNPSDYNESLEKRKEWRSQTYETSSRRYYEPTERNWGAPERNYEAMNRPIVYGQPEQNYEVDEAVSVETNGRAHGLQTPSRQQEAKKDDNQKVGYVVEGRNYRKYRVEERTSDGFIVGEYGVVSHDDGSLRGVRYTADGTINPRLIYDALMKFLSL